MNRGFGFYFAQAMRASCASLWKKGNMLKYLAYVIMSFIARLTGVFGAMFSLANVRQAKIAVKERTVDIPQSFQVACRAKPFFTMLLTILLEALIFLAGLILIGIGSALLGAVGYIVSLFVNELFPYMFVLIFAAPGAIVALVYCIAMFFMFVPTAYIIETNPDIGAANAISICFNTMKSRGKGTYFLTLFVTYLIESFVLALGGAIEFVILLFVTDPLLSLILLIAVALLFIVGFALIAPMFALARKITITSLFEDIVLDPVNASKRTNGVNIRRCKGVKFDPAEYQNELTALFDETASDRIPAPLSASAARKLTERTAVQQPAQPSPEPPAQPAAPVQPTAPAQPAIPAQPTPPVNEPPVELPAEKYAAAEEEEELLTVSDLIRDVEPPADLPSEAAQPVPEPFAEEPAKPEPKPEPEPAIPTYEPVQPEFEVPAEEPAKPEPEPVIPTFEPEISTFEPIPDIPAEPDLPETQDGEDDESDK